MFGLRRAQNNCENNRILNCSLCTLYIIFSVPILSPFELSSFHVLILFFSFFVTDQLVDHIPEIDSASVVIH